MQFGSQKSRRFLTIGFSAIAFVLILSTNTAKAQLEDGQAEELIQLVRDRDPTVRLPAIRDLREKRGLAVAAMTAALKASLATYPQPSVEEAAFRTDLVTILGEIGPDAMASGPVLIDLLRDEDVATRDAALTSLIAIGVDSRIYLPVLQEVASDLRKSDIDSSNLAKVSTPQLIRVISEQPENQIFEIDFNALAPGFLESYEDYVSLPRKLKIVKGKIKGGLNAIVRGRKRIDNSHL